MRTSKKGFQSIRKTSCKTFMEDIQYSVEKLISFIMDTLFSSLAK